MAAFPASNFYETLEVPSTATSLEIKKAYRRLALKYHPDRNQGSAASKEQFQHIGQAYECLGDERKRADYDAVLRGERPSSSAVVDNNAYAYQGHGRPFDPFQQFNHLFRTDPFFQEAFQDLDEEFAKRFTRNGDNNSTAKTAQKETWGAWLLNKCGIQLQMTSYSSDARGGVTASHYSSTDQARKSTRTYIDKEGRQVTFRQRQQHGNSIEDKLVAGQLIERRINGQVVNDVGQRIE